MARKVDHWVAEDGTQHDAEINALRADVRYLQEKVARLQKVIDESKMTDFPRSSYGSSGGGGHD